MKSGSEERKLKTPTDRVEGKLIIIDGKGEFPKRVIILGDGKEREYWIRKTRRGGYLFN